jgi:hypothetical protein
MFQSLKKGTEALLAVVDDMLVGAPEEDVEIALPHPHERTVRLQLERRAGTVAPRQMHCLSPVRAPAQAARDRVR